MASELDDVLFGLCVACMGNTSMVNKIVNNLHWDLSIRGPAGLTALWLAAWNNHVDVVEILAKSSINFDSETHSGITPLMIAAAEGHASMVELLIEKGANVHAIDIDGRSALKYAKDNGRKDVVEILEAATGKTSETATAAPEVTSTKAVGKPCAEHLVRAAGFGDKKTVTELLTKGVDLKAADKSGCLPIVAAAAGGDRDTVQLLIDKKAALNLAQPVDFTPLTAAAGKGHCSIVELLLKHGAEVNAVDGFGRTPLIAAALFNGDAKTIDLLLEKGADANLKVNGYSPLTAAIELGSVDAVKQLIKKGAKVKPTEGEERSLLWFAAASGNVKMAEFIFSAGAELDNNPGSDYLPLVVAAEKGHVDMVKLLLDHNADINAADSQGCTALFKATDQRRSEVAKLLIRQGANVNTICGSTSCMPIHKAARNRDPELLEMLIRHGSDLDFRDDLDNSPLLVAALNGDAKAVKLLASYGADINSYYNNNLTLLLTAVRRGEHEVVRALLEVNADISLRATEVARGLTAMMISVGYDQYSVGRVLHQFSFDQKQAMRNRAQSASCSTTGSVVNLYARDSSGMTSLMYAAQEYNRRFLQLLLGDEPSPRSKEMVNLQDNQGRTALHIAAMDAIDSSRPEQLNVLKILLKHGSDVTIEDNEGRTVLHYASLNVTENEKSEQHLVLQLLIEHGAFVDAADSAGKTAVHYAVLDIEGRELEEQEGVIQLLLSKGASVNIKDISGKTALALVEDQEKAIKEKLEKAPSTADEHPALRSARRLKALLQSDAAAINAFAQGLTKMDLEISASTSGSDAPKQEWENTKHHKGNTETHMAAIISHVASVGSGAPHDAEAYNKQNKDGRTPLCLAAMHSNVEFLHSLSTDTVKGCKYITDNEGKTALHLAASSYQPCNFKGNKEPKNRNEMLVSTMEKANKGNARKSAFQKVYELVGPELRSVKDKLGNTALHCACLALNMEAVKTLIQDRFLLAITNNIGWTPLHCAIGTRVSELDMEKSQELIDELLTIENSEKPRAIFYCDLRGCSLLHLAVLTDRHSIIPQLVRLNPEQLNYDGYSPLHIAAERGSIDVLRAVLHTFYSTNTDEFFRDVDHATQDGKTALFICILNRDDDKTKLLLQYGANLARRGNDGTTAMHQVALSMAKKKNTKKTDDNDTLDVILEHVVLWWCRQRNRLREVYSQDSPDYKAAYRDSVMELTCYMRCKGQNALQFAACNGSFAFLRKIMNTEGVFAEDSGDTVMHYVAHMVPITMPASFANSQPFTLMSLVRSDKDAASQGGHSLENNRDDTSVLERIVNSDNAEEAVSILNCAPFKQLIAPYWMIIEFIYFLLLLVHFSHMLMFTMYSLPTNSWLHERFSDDEEADFVADDAAVESLFVDWHYTLFITWPCIIFLLDLMNAFSYWMSIRSAGGDQSKTEAEDSKGEDETDVDVKVRKKLAKLVFYKVFMEWMVVAKIFMPSLMYSLSFVTSINLWFFVYHYSNLRQAYLVMTAMVLVIGWTYILNFLTIFKGFMTLVGVLRRILLGDIIRFFVVYSFVLVSFSLAFYVLSMQSYSVDDDEPQSVYFTIYTVFLQMIGMEAIYDNMNLHEENLSTTYMTFIRGLFTVYVSISAVVFLNLLVAMMSDTYADAVSDANEAMRADNLRMVSRILLLERRLLIKPMKVLLRTIRPCPLKKAILDVKVKSGEESEKCVLQWELTRYVEEDDVGADEVESMQEKLEALDVKLSAMISSEMSSVNDKLNSISESLQALSASTNGKTSLMESVIETK